jgi:hypothetical protein
LGGPERRLNRFSVARRCRAVHAKIDVFHGPRWSNHASNRSRMDGTVSIGVDQRLEHLVQAIYQLQQPLECQSAPPGWVLIRFPWGAVRDTEE